jgi:uncharacterized protein YjbI with pentapeptide repeats
MHAVLDQASFAGAALTGEPGRQAANVSSAWISNCDFTEANAYSAIFAEATLISGNILAGDSLQESNFSNAYLAGADFTGASLQGATFDGACMVQCKLIRADLTPAEEGAKSSSLTSACLQAADFTDTKLGGANLTSAAIAATTDERSVIEVSHYDEDGNLIGPETIRWVGSPPTPNPSPTRLCAPMAARTSPTYKGA